MGAWWQDSKGRPIPSVRLCTCGVPVQRTPTGSPADGMAQHIATVHNGKQTTKTGVTGECKETP